MGQSSCIIINIVFLLYITGSVSVSVEGFVGDSAVFSCSITESEVQNKIDEFKITWRDDEGEIVCDVIGGKRIVEDKDTQYKGRVETFPREYEKGNFSIKLNNLQQIDARTYYCHITWNRSPFQKRVITELHVKDKPKGKENRREPSLIVLLISFVFTIVLMCI